MLDAILSFIFTSQWLVFLIVSAMLLISAEAGFRFGGRLHRANDEPRKGQVGGIQAAILGLLALLLGFTFAMSTARYETRRALVLEEANAIGTTYLRSALLTKSHQTIVEQLLQEYVDARLKFYDAGQDQPEQDRAEQIAADIQRQLWSQAVAAAKQSPDPLSVSFITSLNQAIDLNTSRLNALRTHVPGAVWILLLIVAVCGCYTSAYAAGASGARTTFASWILPLLIAVVITLIADLDRPRGGLIGINQQPLIDLKESFEPKPA